MERFKAEQYGPMGLRRDALVTADMHRIWRAYAQPAVACGIALTDQLRRAAPGIQTSSHHAFWRDT